MVYATTSSRERDPVPKQGVGIHPRSLLFPPLIYVSTCEDMIRRLTQMKPGVLDRVFEIQSVTEELGDLAREDQGSSLSLLVKEAFPFVCSRGVCRGWSSGYESGPEEKSARESS